MPNRFDQIFRFLSDTRGLEQGTDRVEKKMGGLKGTIGKVGGVIAGAFAAGAVIDFTKESIGLAIAADEAASKFDAVFGSGNAARDAMAQFADKAGVATAKSQDLFATLGNLTTAQGFTRDASIDFADKVGDLAGDLASFNDADPAEVFRELGFAMTTTERESLKKYGIAISEVEVKTRAAALATAAGREEVTKADRALATYNIAVEQAGGAVGDLDRTSDSLANRIRRLNARWEDAKVVLGRELIPVLEEALIPALEAAVPVAADLAGAVGEIVDGVTFLKNPMREAASDIDDTRGAAEKFGDVLADWLGHAARGTAAVPVLGGALGALEERIDRVGESWNSNMISNQQAAEARILAMEEALGPAGLSGYLKDVEVQAFATGRETKLAYEAMAEAAEVATQGEGPILRFAGAMGVLADNASRISDSELRAAFNQLRGAGGLASTTPVFGHRGGKPVADELREEERRQGQTP